MRIKTSRISLVLMVLFIARGATTLEAQSLKPVKITPEWNAKIAKLMPARPRVKPAATRRVLLFSLTTGFKHWTIPHIDRVIELLAEKTGAFEVTRSTDVAVFEREALKRFDAVILNNNCSKGPGRNLFIDVLGDDRSRAARLEKNIRDFVAGGKGLTAIHGAIVCFNNSPEFSDMLGGSFDFHPAQQKVTLDLVEPDHPLLKAFGGKPLVHVDEPYVFKNAYAKKNFRPLLVMDTSNIYPQVKTIVADGGKTPVFFTLTNTGGGGTIGNIYADFSATRGTFGSDKAFVVTFRSPRLAAETLPGQFVIHGCPGTSEPLPRRPYGQMSVLSAPVESWPQVPTRGARARTR